MKDFQQYALGRITDTLTGQYDHFTTADEEREIDLMMWQATAIEGDFYTDGMEEIVGTEREIYWQHWREFGVEHGYFEDYFPIHWTRRLEDFTTMVASEESDAGNESDEEEGSFDYYQEQEENFEDSTTMASEGNVEEESEAGEEEEVVTFSGYSPQSPNYYELEQELRNTTVLIDLTADSNDTIYLD